MDGYRCAIVVGDFTKQKLTTSVLYGIRLPSALPLHPGRAMVIGLGCGLVGLGLLLLIHSLLRLEGIAFIYAIMACTLAMQIVAAVCGPLAARNLAWLHGLCAAQIAGIICVLAFPIWLSSIPWFIPIATLNGGTIIAALVAALSAFLARAVRSI